MRERACSGVYFASTLLLACACGARASTDGEARSGPPDAAVSDTQPDGGTEPSESVTSNASGAGEVTSPASVSDEGAVDGGTGMPTAEQPVDERPSTGDGGLPPPRASDCDVAPTSQVPRLSNEQYGRTIRDLLHVTQLSAMAGQAPAALLEPDTAGELTSSAWQAYRAAAKAIAAEVMGEPSLRQGFVACETLDAECLHDTIVGFGRRAFRRPLTEGEVARFDAIVAQGAEITATGSGEELAQVLLETFLSSPSFLQRAEMSERSDGEHFLLSDSEIASRLSYMLWGSMPDPTLDAAADAGELASPVQVAKHAKRMLQDAKARDLVAGFHRYYLSLDRWIQTSKDATLFPDFTPQVVAAMPQEMELFFDDVVFAERGGFADLFLSPRAFVNADTAVLYGLDPANYGPELQAVELDAVQRPGFLTRVGFLASHSGYSQTSPILRGSFVLRDVLGLDPGAPPVDIFEPFPNAPELDTVRKQVTALTSPNECAGCHKFINPPGFVLEAFNAVGQLQTVEATTGVPIDTVADVFVDFGASVPVTDPAALMTKLAAAPTAQRQYVKRWLEYVFERPEAADSCFVDELTETFPGADDTLLDLFADSTRSNVLRWRKQLETSP